MALQIGHEIALAYRTRNRLINIANHQTNESISIYAVSFFTFIFITNNFSLYLFHLNERRTIVYWNSKEKKKRVQFYRIRYGWLNVKKNAKQFDLFGCLIPKVNWLLRNVLYVLYEIERVFLLRCFWCATICWMMVIMIMIGFMISWKCDVRIYILYHIIHNRSSNGHYDCGMANLLSKNGLIQMK